MIKLEKIKKQLTEIDDINEFFLTCNEGTNTPAKNWFFAILPLEKSFDTFMQQVAEIDRRTVIQFATIFAKYAFTYIYENCFEQVKEVGFAFLESDKCRDGDPIEKQLKNVENWLKEPTQANEEIVRNAIDPSRQMDIWEDTGKRYPPGHPEDAYRNYRRHYRIFQTRFAVDYYT